MTRPPASYVFLKIVLNVAMFGLGMSLAKLTHATFRPLANSQTACGPLLLPAAPPVPGNPARPPPPVAEPPLPGLPAAPRPPIELTPPDTRRAAGRRDATRYLACRRSP